MKLYAPILATAFFIAAPAIAEDAVRSAQTLDVIELKDGSILKGVIVEQVPGQRYKLALLGGSVQVIQATNVVKISKEKNPDYRQPAPPPAPRPSNPNAHDPNYQPRPQASEKSSLPPAVAREGVRLSIAPAVVFPTVEQGIDTSFGGSFGVGYEKIVGNNFGVGGGFRGGYVFHNTEDGGGIEVSAHTISAMGEFRASGHFGAFVPYASLALGVDIIPAEISAGGGSASETTVGFALEFAIGIEYMVTPTVAIGGAFRIHPVAPEPEIMGMGLGDELTFNSLTIGITASL